LQEGGIFYCLATDGCLLENRELTRVFAYFRAFSRAKSAKVELSADANGKGTIADWQPTLNNAIISRSP